jgi:hypothetical protein
LLAAAHISDFARLYRLAIEKSERGAIYNAVGAEGVAARDIAETIGRHLRVPVKSIAPEEAGGYFGWLAHLAAGDMPASSKQTQKKLGRRPTGPGLIADLERLPVPKTEASRDQEAPPAAGNPALASYGGQVCIRPFDNPGPGTRAAAPAFALARRTGSVSDVSCFVVAPSWSFASALLCAISRYTDWRTQGGNP